MDFIKILVVLVITIALFTCTDTEIKPAQVHRVSTELHISDSRLKKAIIDYQNSYILSNYEINKLLIVVPLTSYPKKIFEFRPLEHLNEPLESQYNLVYVQEIPVLFESVYEGLINSTFNKSIEEKIRIYFKNQPALPRTGYLSDVWYVILEPDGYKKINVTDSLKLYNNKQQVLEAIDRILFPCLN